MPKKRRKFDQDFKDGAVRIVIEGSVALARVVVGGEGGRMMPRSGQSVAGVGLVTRRDLRLDERAQHFFRCPSLRLGGVQHVRAMVRTLASLSRFNPAMRSTGNAGVLVTVMRVPRAGKRRA